MLEVYQEWREWRRAIAEQIDFSVIGLQRKICLLHLQLLRTQKILEQEEKQRIKHTIPKTPQSWVSSTFNIQALPNPFQSPSISPRPTMIISRPPSKQRKPTLPLPPDSSQKKHLLQRRLNKIILLQCQTRNMQIKTTIRNQPTPNHKPNECVFIP